MQLSPSQHTALKDMGIPLWQRRGPQQAQETLAGAEVEHISSVSVELFPVQHLIVAPRLPENAEQALLRAILKASGIAQDNYQIILSAEWHLQLELPVQMTHVIHFGRELTSEQQAPLAESVKLVDCPGLADMLLTPALKAQCWLSLKSLDFG